MADTKYLSHLVALTVLFLVLFQVLLQEVDTLAEQVVARVATIDAVVAVGIQLLTEVLVGLDQCLAVFGGIAIVDIVVCQAVNNHQVALQAVDARQGIVVVTSGVLLRGTHETLAIDGVVVTPGGWWCDGYATAEDAPTL